MINLRDKDTGSPPLKYSPRVLVRRVSTLPLAESWLIPPLTCESRWIKTENVAAAVKSAIAADCLRLKVRELAEISNVNLRLS
jgi:hypothetical protein